MKLFYAEPAYQDPPTSDITHVLLYECNTDAATDAGTLVATIDFVANQGYVVYSTPIEGKFYRIKFRDAGGKVSTYPSPPVKFTTVPDTTCAVYDTQLDMSGKPIRDLAIKIILNTTNARYNGKTIGNNEITVRTDDNGNWDIQLIPNTLIVPAGTKYLFVINGKSHERTVPDKQDEKFSNLR